MTSDDPLTILDDPSDDDVRFVENRITEYNFDVTGIRDGRLLAIFVRDAEGGIRAGLAGHTWGGCCEVRFLWVREDGRRAGLGTRLLDAAEREAKARGCEQIALSTHSFQAPEFYRRRGYRVAGEIGGYPRGHSQIFLCKKLA